MNKAVELPNSLPIGTRLAEFEIRQVIGEGGFGIVYLAFDHSLQRTVAIKEYMPAALASRASDHTVSVRSRRHAEAFGAGLRSFINEARLLAQFDHPALVKVYRFWELHGTAYMAMRYYEGRTFKSVVADHPELVSEAWLKGLLQPVLGALDALYAANILHRDVSPENIMIQPDGRPVLLDFGAARQIVQDMAQSLTVILKPGFAPVEQYADDESMRQGPWTDIYSLSAVMYAAITGKAPPAAVARMLNDPIEPLAISGREGYSSQFLEAIDRGMAVRPEIRPQSIAEFAALLGIDGTHDAAAVAAAVAGKAARAPAAAAHGASAPPAANAASAASAANRTTPAARETRAGGAAAAPQGGAGRDKPAAASPSQAGGKAGQAAAKAPPSKAMIAAGVAALVLVVGGIAWLADGSPVAPAASPSAGAAGQPSAIEAPAAGETPAATPAQPPAAASAAAGAASPAAAAPGAAQDAATAAPAAAPTSGSVTIAVQPWATIYVDGVEKGITPPLKKLTLPTGVHEVRLENPNFPPHVQKITVDGRKAVTLKHDFGK